MPDGRLLEYAELGDPRGRPVVYLHGTPATAGAGRSWDGAAKGQGVRLLSVSRPGYGASGNTPPGLASVGQDVAELARLLGMDQFAVVGISGGGPFALAVASQAPAMVSAVLVAAGPGCYSEVAPELLEPEDLEAVALLGRGDPAAAVAVVSDGVTRDMGGLRELAGPEFAEAFGGQIPPGEPDYFAAHPDEKAPFFADVQRALTTFDGFVRDNLSWIAPWDIDLADVRAEVQLAYGSEDHMVPVLHGEWLQARLPSAALTVHPGAGHGEVTMGLADAHLGALV